MPCSSSLCRLSLPALGVGAYHIAILRHDGEPPTPQALQAQAMMPQQQQQQQAGVARTTVLLPEPRSSPGAVASPLLLQPLVVLPQGPAEELQQLWNAGCQRLWTADRAAAAAGAGLPPVSAPQAAAGSGGASSSSSSSSASSGAGGGGAAQPAAQGDSQPLPSPMRAVQVRPDGTWFALSSTPVPFHKLLAQRHLVLAWQHMMCALLQDVAFLLCWADGSTMAGPVSRNTAPEPSTPGTAASSRGADSGARHTQQGPSSAPSTTAAAPAAGGAARPSGEPHTVARSELLHLQVVLQPLLHYLATHRMWALADFLVRVLLLRQQQLMQLSDPPGEEVAEEAEEGLGNSQPPAVVPRAGAQSVPGHAAGPSAAAVDAATKWPVMTSSSDVAAAGTQSARPQLAIAAAAAGRSSDVDSSVPASSYGGYGGDSDSDTPASTGSSIASSSRMVPEPLGLRRRRGAGAKHSHATQEQDEASAADQVEAAQPQLEVNVWQRHSLRQLLMGFASPQLETAYMQYTARMSQTADLVASLLTILAAPSAGVGADLPYIAAAVGWPAALWQRRYDIIFLLLFVVPALVILSKRPWLMRGRR